MAATAEVDDKGRTKTLDENLVPGISAAQVEHALSGFETGAGGETRRTEKRSSALCSAYGSAALALNSFARWHGSEEHLKLGSLDGLETGSLRFETKLPIGDGGGIPHLDLTFDWNGGLVGVESKCLEYLDPKKPQFADVYEGIVERRADVHWQSVYENARSGGKRHVDVAQLVKHYLGLQAGGDQAALFYVFWEPANAADVPSIAEHREEVGDLVKRLEASAVPLVALSYPDLWSAWVKQSQPGWAGDHADALREKYLVSI